MMQWCSTPMGTMKCEMFALSATMDSALDDQPLRYSGSVKQLWAEFSNEKDEVTFQDSDSSVLWVLGLAWPVSNSRIQVLMVITSYHCFSLHSTLFTPLRVGWPPTPQLFYGSFKGLRGAPRLVDIGSFFCWITTTLFPPVRFLPIGVFHSFPPLKSLARVGIAPESHQNDPKFGPQKHQNDPKFDFSTVLISNPKKSSKNRENTSDIGAWCKILWVAPSRNCTREPPKWPKIRSTEAPKWPKIRSQDRLDLQPQKIVEKRENTSDIGAWCKILWVAPSLEKTRKHQRYRGLVQNSLSEPE